MKVAMAALVCAVSFLSGCGGGGGGGNAAVPPAIALPAAPHTGAPGTVDTSFAGTGLFRLPQSAIPNSSSFADAIATLESGKLIVSGAFQPVKPNALNVPLLVRLLPDGTLDRSLFGTGFVDFSGSTVESVVSTRVVPLKGDTFVWPDFSTQPCFATRCPVVTGTETNHLFVRRMTAEGRVDSSYAGVGTATGHLAPSDLVAGADGSLLVVGTTDRLVLIAFDAN